MKFYLGTREPPLPGCTHKNCGNCALFATQWAAETLASIDRTVAQQELFPV